METKVLAAPQKYIQGQGALKELAGWAKKYGDKIYVIFDDFVKSLTADRILEGAKKEGIKVEFGQFNGESSDEEIEKHVKNSKPLNPDVIVGVGGGKTLDTAKAVAHLTGDKPVIICPTLASTDAPTSALTIVYTEDGEFKRYMGLPFNPNIVLIDTDIVVQAPAKFLIAGIGDAMATFYEAKVCVEANATNMAGGKPTKAAYAIATLCRDILFKHGAKAVEDCKNKKVTPEFEAVVEANTLLSGLGFESCGLAAAHSVHDGLTELHESHSFLHGEKVAFGYLTEAMMNNQLDIFDELVKYNLSIGLPVCLEDYGIIDDVENKAEIVAKKTVAEGETIHSYAEPIGYKKVKDAILKANQRGKELKAQAK